MTKALPWRTNDRREGSLQQLYGVDKPDARRVYMSAGTAKGCSHPPEVDAATGR
ncbi:MAG: hypothetical protein IJP45_03550 [Paludibacteraceae bacterium]|nr:hypothetical protein [Paludibacteraceae bacterium]